MSRIILYNIDVEIPAVAGVSFQIQVFRLGAIYIQLHEKIYFVDDVIFRCACCSAAQVRMY